MRTARSRISGENFGDFLILAPFSSEGASAKPGAVQAYAGDSPHKADELLAQVRQEFEAVLKERDAP